MRRHGRSRRAEVIRTMSPTLNHPRVQELNMQFTDAFYPAGCGAEFSEWRSCRGAVRRGLNTLSAAVDFKSARPSRPAIARVAFGRRLPASSQDRTTGAQAYTRDGQLQFDKGRRADLHLDGGNTSSAIGTATRPCSASRWHGLRTNPAKADVQRQRHRQHHPGQHHAAARPKSTIRGRAFDRRPDSLHLTLT